jgi:hypothetical protein
MSVLDEVLSANDRYAASFGQKAELTLPPARRFAILTCMDARLDPADPQPPAGPGPHPGLRLPLRREDGQAHRGRGRDGSEAGARGGRGGVTR